MYNFVSDNVGETGFIDKDTILQYIGEKDIFKIVFGYTPIEDEYITSPFRVDNKPGCKFIISHNDKLVFNDFASTMPYMDCFDAIQIHYGFKSFYQTLRFLHKTYVQGKKPIISGARPTSIIKARTTSIQIENRLYERKDINYWKQYGITIENLIADHVHAVSKYKVLKSKTNGQVKRVYDICYAYTPFKKGRMKLYFPKRKGKVRFLSTCTKNDLGLLANHPTLGNKVIITKSYKDCRVLRNLGYHSIWIQSEGTLPKYSILYEQVGGYRSIYLWYDNDPAGKKAADIFITTYTSLKITNICLPDALYLDGVTDVSDYYKKNKRGLMEFLKSVI